MNLHLVEPGGEEIFFGHRQSRNSGVLDVDMNAGFNLSRTVIPDCLEDVVGLLVPALQERGRYKRAYAPGTYREKLFGAGPRLSAPHPAAAVAR